MSEGYDPADICGDCDCDYPECGLLPDVCRERAAEEYWENCRDSHD